MTNNFGTPSMSHCSKRKLEANLRGLVLLVCDIYAGKLILVEIEVLYDIQTGKSIRVTRLNLAVLYL